jgi:hypothetical protein
MGMRRERVHSLRRGGQATGSAISTEGWPLLVQPVTGLPQSDHYCRHAQTAQRD